MENNTMSETSSNTEKYVDALYNKYEAATLQEYTKYDDSVRSYAKYVSDFRKKEIRERSPELFAVPYFDKDGTRLPQQGRVKFLDESTTGQHIPASSVPTNSSGLIESEGKLVPKKTELKSEKMLIDTYPSPYTYVTHTQDPDIEQISKILTPETQNANNDKKRLRKPRSKNSRNNKAVKQDINNNNTTTAKPTVEPIVKALQDLALTKPQDDIEKTPPEKKFFKYDVLWALDKDQKKYMHKQFPGTEFVPINSISHPHPCTAIIRNIAEAFVFELAQKEGKLYGNKSNRIYWNVNGNPNRFDAIGVKNVHCNYPPKDSYAHHKSATFSNAKNGQPHPSWCVNSFEDCGCSQMVGCGIFDAAMFIYTMQDFTPEEIYTIISSTICQFAVAVDHKYTGGRGYMYNKEGYYYMDENARMHVSIEGNDHNYVFDHNIWLNDCYYESKNVSDARTGAMTWSSVKKFPDSEVYVFRIAPRNLRRIEPMTKNFNEAMHDNNHVSLLDNPISTMDFNYRPDKLLVESFRKDFTDDTIISFLNHAIIIPKSKKPVFIPKELLAKVATSVVFTDRLNPNNIPFDAAKAAMKQCLTNMPLDEVEKLDILTYGLPYAFIMNLKNEISSYKNTVVKNDTLLQMQSTIMSIIRRPINIYNTWKYGVTATVSIVAVAVSLIAAASIYRSFTSAFSSAYKDINAHSLIKTQHIYKPMSTLSVLRILFGRLYRTIFKTNKPKFITSDICCKEAKLLPLSPTAKITLPQDFDCTPSDGLLAVFSCVRRPPFVPRPCAHNFIVGIVNRYLLKELQRPIDFLYNYWEFNKYKHEIIDIMFPKDNISPSFPQGLQKIIIMPVEQWISKFSGPKLKMYTRMLDFFRRFRRLYPNRRTSHSFVKLEPHIISDGVHVYMFFPRPIQEPPKQFALQLGPFINSFLKEIKKHFSVGISQGERKFRSPHIVVGTATNVHTLGFLLEEALKQGYTHMYDGDAKHFDGSEEAALQSDIFSIYSAVCPDEELIDLFYKFLNMPGSHLNHDRLISYIVNGKMQSGRPDTWMTNTLLMTMVSLYSLYREKIPMQDIILIVSGDDVLFLSRTPIKVTKIIATFFKLNIEIEFKQCDIYTLEFCQQVPWPTGNTYTFGPKPGRLMSRTGNVQKRHSGFNIKFHMRCICLGIRMSTHHVPILNDWVERIMNITSGEKHAHAIPYDDPFKLPILHYVEPDEDTLLFFCKRYSLEIDEYVSLQKYLTKMKIYEPIDHPALTKILDVDVPIKTKHGIHPESESLLANWPRGSLSLLTRIRQMVFHKTHYFNHKGFAKPRLYYRILKKTIKLPFKIIKLGFYAILFGYLNNAVLMNNESLGLVVYPGEARKKMLYYPAVSLVFHPEHRYFEAGKIGIYTTQRTEHCFEMYFSVYDFFQSIQNKTNPPEPKYIYRIKNHPMSLLSNFPEMITQQQDTQNILLSLKTAYNTTNAFLYAFFNNFMLTIIESSPRTVPFINDVLKYSIVFLIFYNSFFSIYYLRQWRSNFRRASPYLKFEMLANVTIIPILEEMIKRYDPIGFVAITTIEFGTAGFTGVLKHLITTLLPLPLGIVMHIANNIIAGSEEVNPMSVIHRPGENHIVKSIKKLKPILSQQVLDMENAQNKSNKAIILSNLIDRVVSRRVNDLATGLRLGTTTPRGRRSQTPPPRFGKSQTPEPRPRRSRSTSRNDGRRSRSRGHRNDGEVSKKTLRNRRRRERSREKRASLTKGPRVNWRDTVAPDWSNSLKGRKSSRQEGTIMLPQSEKANRTNTEPILKNQLKNTVDVPVITKYMPGSTDIMNKDRIDTMIEKNISILLPNSVYVINTDTTGLIYFVVPVNPSLLAPNTRLEYDGKKYRSWRVVDVQVEYIPDVGYNENGSIYLIWNPDATDQNMVPGQSLNLLAATDTRVKKLIQLMGNPNKDNRTPKISMSKDETNLYTSSTTGHTISETTYGQFIVGCNEPASNSTSSTLSGQLVLHATMQFFNSYEEGEQDMAVQEATSPVSASSLFAPSNLKYGYMLNYLTITGNTIQFTKPTRYLITVIYSTSAADTNTVTFTYANGITVTVYTQSFANVGAAASLMLLTADILGNVTNINPATMTINGVVHANGYAKIFITEIDAGNVPDTLAEDSVNDEMDSLVEKVAILSGEKPKYIYKHDRVLYKRMPAYKSLLNKIGEESLSTLNDLDVRNAMRQFFPRDMLLPGDTIADINLYKAKKISVRNDLTLPEVYKTSPHLKHEVLEVSNSQVSKMELGKKNIKFL